MSSWRNMAGLVPKKFNFPKFPQYISTSKIAKFYRFYCLKIWLWRLFSQKFSGGFALTPPGCAPGPRFGLRSHTPICRGLHPKLKLGAWPQTHCRTFLNKILWGFIAYKYMWTIEDSKNMKLKYFKNWLIVILNY